MRGLAGDSQEYLTFGTLSGTCRAGCEGESSLEAVLSPLMHYARKEWMVTAGGLPATYQCQWLLFFRSQASFWCERGCVRVIITHPTNETNSKRVTCVLTLIHFVDEVGGNDRAQMLHVQKWNGIESDRRGRVDRAVGSRGRLG